MTHKMAAMKDDIGGFWVVTKKISKDSSMQDIKFQTDTAGMIRQHLGGLEMGDILLITKSKAKATRLANKVLKD